ncbi:NOP9, partial [Symbiodinium sp. KB8]
KPRKLDDSAVEYLRQLELPLRDADAEQRHILTRRVLEELLGREASAATSKKCSYLVENVLSQAPILSVATFAASLADYLPFVSCDRFGSHVLQTCLSRLGSAAEGGGESDEEDASATARKSIYKLSDSLTAALQDFAFDTCATHVARSLVAALGGLKPPAQRRNGFEGARAHKKKKKKSRAQAAFASSAAEMRELQAAGVACEAPGFAGSSETRQHLEGWIRHVASWNAEDICSAACDSNAGPVLQLIVQAAAASDVGVRLSHPAAAATSSSKLISNSSQLDVTLEGDLLPLAVNAILTRKHDEVEGVDEPAEASAEESRFGDTAEERMLELMKDEVGCRLLQASMAAAPRLVVPWLLEDVAESRWGGILSHRIAHHAAADMIAASAHAGSALESGVLVDVLPLLHKALEVGHERVATALTLAGDSPGVATRARTAIATGLIRLAKRYIAVSDEDSSSHTELVRWWLDLGGARSSPPGSGQAVSEAAAGSGAAKSGVGVLSASVDRAMPGAMGGEEKPENYVSVHGARVVGALLHWTGSAAELFRSGVAGLTSDDIRALALHPAGSKHVLEPVLAPSSAANAPSELDAPLSVLRRKVVKHLKGQWAQLATDRAGSWLVEKAFLGSDLPTRARMVSELADSERALSGVPSGRAVLRLLRVQHFKNQRSSWDALQTRQMLEAEAASKKAAKKAKKAKKVKKAKKASKSDAAAVAAPSATELLGGRKRAREA